MAVPEVVARVNVESLHRVHPPVAGVVEDPIWQALNAYLKFTE